MRLRGRLFGAGLAACATAFVFASGPGCGTGDEGTAGSTDASAESSTTTGGDAAKPDTGTPVTDGGGCKPSEIACGGTCVDPATSNQHCGTCGVACTAPDVCSAGVCALVCTSPLTKCDPSKLDGGVADAGGADAAADAGGADAGAPAPYCANLQTSATNCGACGKACDAVTETCSVGACICKPGRVRCGGDCIDPKADEKYCGASGDCTAANAGVSCEVYQGCDNGACANTPLGGTGTAGDPYVVAGGLASCKAYKTAYAGAANDGWYKVDPAGTPFNVYCDQTQSGGGWTRCLEFVNTAVADVTDNDWFDTCVTYAGAAWQTGDLLIDLRDQADAIQYSTTGQKLVDWTNDQITSTAANNLQYHSGNHSRLVSLANGDKLMISGKAAANSGCGGSMGNGYGIVIYPDPPSYYSNPKYFVMPHQQFVAPYAGTRSFGPWSTDREIAHNGGASFNSCSTIFAGGPQSQAFLGKFEFFVR